MATRRKHLKSPARRHTPEKSPREKQIEAALRKARATDERKREARAARTAHGAVRARGSAPTPATAATPSKPLTWADFAKAAKLQRSLEVPKQPKPARSKASEIAPARGGPWMAPSATPRTWAQAVADSKAQLARAKADQRAADRDFARAKREQARCDAAVERARQELADKTGRKAKARGEKKLKEQLARAQDRLARIEHESPGTIEQYQAITAWFEMVGAGASVEAERDGTVNGILEIPGFDEPEQLTRALEGAIENVPVGTWVRVGWKFRTDESRRFPSPATEADRGRPGYDGKWYCNVMSPWYPPHESAQAVIVALDENAPHGSIFHNMLSPDFNHKVLGAVIELHYSPFGAKPDRR
jgi:hypothetical protein